MTEVLELVLGASFAVTGAIAWKCRPANATGPLMIAYGLVQLAALGLLELGTPLSMALGILLGDGATAIFVLVLLGFPRGRLSSRRDWLILGPVLLAVGPLEVLG